MDISSYTSNIQPYGSLSGTDVASKNSGKVSGVSDQNEGQPQVKKVADQEPENSQMPSVAQQVAQEHEQLSKEQRAKMVEKMNEFISSIDRGLSFKVDKETGREVVTIYEAKTGHVIRQIPDREMLEILRRLAAQASGSGLLEDKV